MKDRQKHAVVNCLPQKNEVQNATRGVSSHLLIAGPKPELTTLRQQAIVPDLPGPVDHNQPATGNTIVFGPTSHSKYLPFYRVQYKASHPGWGKMSRAQNPLT